MLIGSLRTTASNSVTITVLVLHSCTILPARKVKSFVLFVLPLWNFASFHYPSSCSIASSCSCLCFQAVCFVYIEHEISSLILCTVRFDFSRVAYSSKVLAILGCIECAKAEPSTMIASIVGSVSASVASSSRIVAS